MTENVSDFLAGLSFVNLLTVHLDSPVGALPPFFLKPKFPLSLTFRNLISGTSPTTTTHTF